MNHTRRGFLKFLGLGFLGSCIPVSSTKSNLPFKPVLPSLKDDLLIAEGFDYDILIAYGDQINQKGDTFGFNNDYTASIPINEMEAFFWVNHEYTHDLFVTNLVNRKKTKKDVDLEKYNLGGSLLKIKKNLKTNRWYVDKKSGVRYNGFTKIPFASQAKVLGANIAEGTFANCAGGVTPWKTFLTCEENYQHFYGEHFRDGKRVKSKYYHWEDFDNNPPEHYGWVVEINPRTKKAKKLTSLGRFAHECCKVKKLSDGRVVAYSGDDKEFEFLYKFISSKKNSLEEGELFVADVKKGKWISLDINKNATLKKNFKNQLEVLIYVREAARLVGASPLDRPEDIEISPINGDVFVCLSNNKKIGNYHGSILKISEKNGKHDSLEFKASNFLVGGEKIGFSCPDNLSFDKNGNLWMTNDISGRSIGKDPYKSFGNNGLFFIPTQGKYAGQVTQIASAPKDAELTGLSFSEDYKTLFLSVQHPGELSKNWNQLTSHWPNKIGTPKPAVVQIYGKSLDFLVSSSFI